MLIFISTLACLLGLPLLYRFHAGIAIFLLSQILAIRNFNVLAQMVHASSHSTLLRNRSWNNRLGSLGAGFLLYTRAGFKETHLLHHNYLNTGRDPDQIFARPNLRGRKILAGFFSDLLFVTALRRFVQYFKLGIRRDRNGQLGSALLTETGKFFRKIFPILMAQLLLVSVYFLVLNPFFYLWFHVLPLLTLYPLQARIRSMAEHCRDGEPEGGKQEDAWHSRTTKSSFLELFIMGPMGQNYHFEHHLFPAIPLHFLPLIHGELKKAQVPIPQNSSYVGYLWKMIR